MSPIVSMTEYPHIGLDTEGRPAFVGKRFRLSMLIGSMQGPDKPSVETLIEWYPVLGPAMIHSGLAYYHDHKQEVDDLMAREHREYQEEWEKQYATESHQKLVAKIQAYRAAQATAAEAS